MTKTKKMVFFVMTIFLVLLVCIGVAAGVEVFYRVAMKPSYSYSKIKISKSLEEALQKKNDGDIKTHIPVHYPEPTNLNPVEQPWSNHNFAMYDPGYYWYDPEIGSVPSADGIFASRKLTSEGTVVYETKYTIDAYRRRVVPGQSGSSRQNSLLFLGCSFTYGEGLKDTETLAFDVAQKASRYRAYIYAFHGWGPGNLLRWASKPDFGAGISEKKGKAIYLFMDHHLTRVVGNLSLTRAVPDWRKGLPNYFLNEKGELQSHGMLANGRPFETWLFKWLSLSSFLAYYKVDIPFQFTDEHFLLFADILNELKRKLAEKAGIQDFYVVMFPGSQLGKALIPFLDKLGISSVDYSDLNLDAYGKVMAIPNDGHPSAEADRFLAKQLVLDLRLK